MTQSGTYTIPYDTSAITAVDVTKTFGSGADAVTALKSVSFTVRENEFFTLLGPSGCGKTTLLRLIAGFEHPTDGQILMSGSPISHLPPYQRPVNTVFQNYALFPHMTASQNIGFGLEMKGYSKREIKDAVDRMLELVRMTTLADRKISQLSGGQQQRIALARALAPRPNLLLLDEPLSALDLKLRREMQIELKRLQHETRITFILVTHDQEEALTMSDRIAVMNYGAVRQIGTPRDIYDHPNERFVAHFIGETNFVEGELVSAQGNIGRVRLGSSVLPASLPRRHPPGGKVNVMIRPEHADLVADPEAGLLSGRVINIVYLGTDTHYHLYLDIGIPFTVRQQNRRDSENLFPEGCHAGITVRDNAAQILLD